MDLKLAHKILIISGIVLGVLLVLFSFGRYLFSGDGSLIPTGVIGGVSAVLLFFYLRWFRKKHA